MPDDGVADHPLADRAATWAKHEYALKAFREVVEVTRAHRLDVLPVKGIVLAHAIYDRVEDRPMVDVDFRVRPRDLRRLMSIAKSAGWPIRVASRQLGTMEIQVSRTLVEFESSVGPPGVCALAVDDLIARASRQTTLGVEHLEPELHDHTLLLCVNAFKDKLVLAKPWVREDLRRIVATPEFDVQEFAARITRAQVRTLTWIVAEWLEATSTAPGAWTRVREILQSGRRRRHYATAYTQLARWAPESAVMALVARAASDSATLRLKAVALGVWGTLLEAGRGLGRDR